MRLIGALAGLTLIAVPVAAAPPPGAGKPPSRAVKKPRPPARVDAPSVPEPILPRDLVPSQSAARVIAWVAASHDNGALPYAVIDKTAAALFLFDEQGAPVGQAPVLIGVGVGDDSSPGVGVIDPQHALHAVITDHKAERRVERLRSPTPDDNRITFGCINVDALFYTGTVTPLFRRHGGVVYILPDTRPLDDVFPRLRLLPYLGVMEPTS